MPVREIILIDEEKCDGCGLCIPSCPEGALAIIDGKARLVSESYCDGMGACIGECPLGALTVVKREAPEFDQAAVEANIRKAHMAQKKPSHPALESAFGGCPGSRMMVLERKSSPRESSSATMPSELTQWPIQLHLVSPLAPYFDGRELLVAADCVPFANPNFHSELLKGRSLIIACPKLDEISGYAAKIAQITKNNDIPKIIVVHMEVPCCFGMLAIVKQAVEMSGKDTPVEPLIMGVDGEYRQR